jgi:hypothetical protein
MRQSTHLRRGNKLLSVGYAISSSFIEQLRSADDGNGGTLHFCLKRYGPLDSF